MRRPSPRPAAAPRSALRESPAESLLVELHGEAATDPEDDGNLIVGMECSPEVGRCPAEYVLIVRGDALAFAQDDSHGNIDGKGVRFGFRSPTALRAAVEMLTRALVTAERHGLLPPVATGACEAR